MVIRTKESIRIKRRRFANFANVVIKKYFYFLAVSFLIIANPVFAHVENELILTEIVSKTSYSIVAVGGFLILFLAVLAIINKNAGEFFKKAVFILVAIISVGVTFYLAGVTVYVNRQSESNGPVHWHADFKIFACGKEERLVEPTGLSNRIGRTDLHEHGDRRIHVEGVVVKKADVALREFFKVIGGSLDFGELTFPGREEFKSYVNGDKCADGRPGVLQAFVYKTQGDEIKQYKLDDYPDYVLAGYSQVPPGDCIILEFSPDQKEKTDEMCDFTSIAINKGDYKYGN